MPDFLASIGLDHASPWLALLGLPAWQTIKWLIEFIRGDSKAALAAQKDVIENQERVARGRETRVEHLEEDIDRLRSELDAARGQIHALRNQMQMLINQMVRAGIVPEISPSSLGD